MRDTTCFKNPFKPGAGHMPPYLAGRTEETSEFEKLIEQDIILENIILTGLRGLGKTVLLETFKVKAIQNNWLWAGTDLSESSSVNEINLATRILTDISIVTSAISIQIGEENRLGFQSAPEKIMQPLNFGFLSNLFDATPGLVSDKLKFIFEFIWPHISSMGKKGIIFAYDEAQNLADHNDKDQFPLSLLLDVFQSIQRKNIPFMLLLTGLPTLFPKLVDARTFAERMFHIISLKALNEAETREAILKPIEDQECPIRFTEDSIGTIWGITSGYPYFVQFICKECYDVWVQNIKASIPTQELIRKLDTDFFDGRWSKLTDRQRELLTIIAHLNNADQEFTPQDVLENVKNNELDKPFGRSHINQMLSTLSNAGLVYKNRYGKYSLAVPLLSDFIRRQSVQ